MLRKEPELLFGLPILAGAGLAFLRRNDVCWSAGITTVSTSSPRVDKRFISEKLNISLAAFPMELVLSICAMVAP